MSNVQHAAAPWAAKKVDDDNLIRIKNADGGQVAICSNFSFFDTPETLPGKELVNEANARRIVACVNACEGISTTDLVALGGTGLLAKANHNADVVKKQRDQLLAALEQCAASMEGDKLYVNTLAYAQRAIAAAKPRLVRTGLGDAHGPDITLPDGTGFDIAAAKGGAV